VNYRLSRKKSQDVGNLFSLLSNKILSPPQTFCHSPVAMNNTSPRTIDCTPTWSSILPILIELVNKSRTRKDATIELERMAKMADAYIAMMKK
jgi:hypothetical protein